MNQKLIYLLFFLGSVAHSGFAQPSSLEIGDRAPETDRTVVDTSERNITLSEVADNNGLLVIFSGNTCPWVAKWEDRYNELEDLASQNDIGMIALNSNERTRNRGESMADMKMRAQKQGYEFIYALDEDHEIADAFGAQHTPEAFLFDSNLELVYHGAIDDNANNENAVNSKYLEEAILAIARGEDIQNPKTQIQGCRIKRTE